MAQPIKFGMTLGSPQIAPCGLFVRDPEAEAVLVQEVIGENLGGWDIQKLEENFALVDVNSMCSILICHFSEDDWAWTTLEKRGDVTVRSGHRVLIAEWQRIDTTSSSGINSSII
jgi:hypothetical protein